MNGPPPPTVVGLGIERFADITRLHAARQLDYLPSRDSEISVRLEAERVSLASLEGSYRIVTKTTPNEWCHSRPCISPGLFVKIEGEKFFWCIPETALGCGISITPLKESSQPFEDVPAETSLPRFTTCKCHELPHGPLQFFHVSHLLPDQGECTSSWVGPWKHLGNAATK
ncbi:hypothetical protein BDA99DRAFT_535508 [Phascolomyces articulosus]|uniref:Uncharacterized protein n=1 Tax=Phascolomyces articulosus TaxID=60185 RepID=A0AAD5K3G3_9FUNG|nr:hypothetical protein BDA99DRAFT_535508 [Phascolomyces articulosus]